MLNNHEEEDYFGFLGLSPAQKIEYLENQKLEFLEEPNAVNVPIDRKCRKMKEYKRKKKPSSHSSVVISADNSCMTTQIPFQSILNTNFSRPSTIISINDMHDNLPESPKKRRRGGRQKSSSQIKEEIKQPKKRQKLSKVDEKPIVRQSRKLKLNDALSVLEEAKGSKRRKISRKSDNNNNPISETVEQSLSKAGWSEARIKAYKNKDKNPNAYYYRFNEEDESQKTGEWDMDEISLFYNNIIEMGVNYNWGLFSRNIEGRVGYQCSNFYRKLIQSNDVYDSCYYSDGKGLRFSHSNKGEINHYIILKPTQNEIKNMLKKKYGSKVIVIIPNLKDPVTEKGVLNPAVDKDGNCMSIETWKTVKNFKKIKPVRLDESNIESYLKKIHEVNSVAFKDFNKKK